MCLLGINNNAQFHITERAVILCVTTYLHSLALHIILSCAEPVIAKGGIQAKNL